MFKNKYLIIILAIYFGGLIVFFSFLFDKQINSFSTKMISILPEKENIEISMIFTGDIMLDRGVEYMIKKNNDWNWPFNNFNLKADLVVGNLESQISDKGTKVGSIYSFRADPQSMETLKSAGFNVVNVNNNHFLDYGSEAFLDSLKRLNENNISYFGGGKNEAEAFSPLIKEINHTKIAFLGYSDLGTRYWRATQDKSGIAWITEDNFQTIQKQIEELKKQVDIVIITIHSGEEYTQELTSFQQEFSKTVIDAGADLVIGHHPHIVQKYEEYKGKYIFYSLGNLLFDQGFSEETMTGQIVNVLIKNKKIEGISIQKTKQNKEFQVQLTNEIQKIK